MFYEEMGERQMKVIVCDLKGTGARWLFLGDKVLVDLNYINDFTKEYPESKTAS